MDCVSRPRDHRGANHTGHFVTSSASTGLVGRTIKSVAMGLMILTLAACGGLNLFSAPKMKEEEIIPPETL